MARPLRKKDNTIYGNIVPNVGNDIPVARATLFITMSNPYSVSAALIVICPALLLCQRQ
jgi:hypothetical protein